MTEMILHSLWIPANKGGFPAINSKMEFSYLCLVNQEHLISSREVKAKHLQGFLKSHFPLK